MELIYLIPGLRVLIGLLLILSASLKLPDLKGFSLIVASYGILPARLVKITAYTQPVLEFIIGWWILSGKQLLYGATAGLTLVLIASIFVAYGLIKQKKMKNCGCYGTAIVVPLTWKKFWENIVWVLLTTLLIAAAIQAKTYGY